MKIVNWLSILLLLTTLIACSSEKSESDLTLTKSSLGPLKLNKDTVISLEYLQSLFPTLDISHEIASGDSTDYHYFKAHNKDKKLLFTITSYIKFGHGEQGGIESYKEIHIDNVTVHSPKIKDQYGIKVGDGYQEVAKKRGENLKFGVAHSDISAGAEMIFYNIALPDPGNGPDRDPASVEQQEVIDGNWPVSTISWPKASW